MTAASFSRAAAWSSRAGADTQVIVHIPLSQLRQLPSAQDLEDAWIRARLGEDGYLTGKDAEAAACDAQVVPVVTGTMDDTVIDQMVSLARTAAESDARAKPLSPGAWRALRYTMARLAVDLVSGPTGAATVLRRGVLGKPYNTPSLLLDIGYKDTIPGHIRRAVLLRDKKCAWPRCGRPAVYCDSSFSLPPGVSYLFPLSDASLQVTRKRLVVDYDSRTERAVYSLHQGQFCTLWCPYRLPLNDQVGTLNERNAT